MPDSQKMDKEQFCKDLLPVLKKMHLPYKSKINDLVYTIENGFAEYINIIYENGHIIKIRIDDLSDSYILVRIANAIYTNA